MKKVWRLKRIYLCTISVLQFKKVFNRNLFLFFVKCLYIYTHTHIYIYIYTYIYIYPFCNRKNRKLAMTHCCQNSSLVLSLFKNILKYFFNVRNGQLHYFLNNDFFPVFVVRFQRAKKRVSNYSIKERL